MSQHFDDIVNRYFQRDRFICCNKMANVMALFNGVRCYVVSTYLRLFNGGTTIFNPYLDNVTFSCGTTLYEPIRTVRQAKFVKPSPLVVSSKVSTSRSYFSPSKENIANDLKCYCLIGRATNKMPTMTNYVLSNYRAATTKCNELMNTRLFVSCENDGQNTWWYLVPVSDFGLIYPSLRSFIIPLRVRRQ